MTKIEEIRATYKERYKMYLQPIASQLEAFVLDQIKEYQRIDRVVGRAKDVESFMGKACKEENGVMKYSDPLNQIQDQIGVRIICYYTADLQAIQRMILDYFSPIEEILIVPDDESQFGYEGIHYILFIPEDVRDPSLSKNEWPEFFELQIKTLFQHAWAEANHDLAYKSEHVLNKDQSRQVAFTAAQAWGADHIFDQLANALIEGYAP